MLCGEKDEETFILVRGTALAEKGRQARAVGSGEKIPAGWKYGDKDSKFKSTVAQFIVKEIQ